MGEVKLDIALTGKNIMRGVGHEWRKTYFATNEYPHICHKLPERFRICREIMNSGVSPFLIIHMPGLGEFERVWKLTNQQP